MKLTLQLVVVVLIAPTKFRDNLFKFTLYTVIIYKVGDARCRNKTTLSMTLIHLNWRSGFLALKDCKIFRYGVLDRVKRSFIRQSTQGPCKIDFEFQGKILQTVIQSHYFSSLSRKYMYRIAIASALLMITRYHLYFLYAELFQTDHYIILK